MAGKLPHTHGMSFTVFLLLLALAPSRAPLKDCKWEQISDKATGLHVWVQRCDYGFRKIDFFMKGNSLLMRYSDGGQPEPVIDVFDLHPGESAEADLKRIFAEQTKKSIASKCKLVRYREASSRPGVKRYTFAPKVPAKQTPDEVPDPQCGPYGETYDSIEYFEVLPRRAQSALHPRWPGRAPLRRADA